MKERPILFSAPMVRALLDGTKTQTRRVIKVPKRGAFVLIGEESEGGAITPWQPYESDDGESHVLNDGNERPMHCPYGQPGDRLWVRETWRAPQHLDGVRPVDMPPTRALDYLADAASEQGNVGKTRVSIYMPRWASRITLEVTSVRVERLQDISRDDAMAEGVERAQYQAGDPLVAAWKDYLDPSNAFFGDPIASFRSLWISINGAESWDANPWVWCIGFRRVEKATP